MAIYTAYSIMRKISMLHRQRRSQVSLAGGGADRIPGGGGINLNTYSYGKRDNAIISPHYKLNLITCMFER